MNSKILVEFEIATTFDDPEKSEKAAAGILADELQKAGIIGSAIQTGLFKVQLIKMESVPLIIDGEYAEV
jgi:hypothetical protein